VKLPVPAWPTVMPPEQSTSGPVSVWHCRVDQPTPTVNANVGVLSLLGVHVVLAGHAPFGPAVMATLGAVELIENICDFMSVLPAVSATRTKNVCVPPPSGELVNGEVHAENVPMSIAHSIVVGLPVVVNVNVGRLLLGSGVAFVIVTVGPIVLTVNERVALDEFPAASVTTTSNTCAPSGRFVVGANGEVQATSGLLSKWHMIVAGAPAVLNANGGFCTFVGPLGPLVIVTVGATVSTRIVRLSLFVLFAASETWTVNVCEPSTSAADWNGDVQVANAPLSTLHWIEVGLPAVVNVHAGVLSFVFRSGRR